MQAKLFQASRIPLGLAYGVVAALTVALTRVDGGVAFLWFAGALLIADLLSRPRRQWPASIAVCALASLLVTGLFGLGWRLALPFAAINMLEAVVAATVVRRSGRSSRPLGSLSWLLRLVIAAGIVAPLLVSALAAVTLLSIGQPALATFKNFYTGHALGNLTLIPLALLVTQGTLRKAIRGASRRDTIEGIALLLLVAVISAAVFFQDGLPLLFLPFLPIILVTFRLGRGGAALAIVVVALVGGLATLAGHGPIELIGDDAGQRMHFFQFYLAATVLSVLPVASDLQQRKQLHRALRLSEQRYRLMTEYSTDVLLHLEIDGRVRFVSPSIKHLGGHDPDRLAGQSCWPLVAPEHLERVRAGHAETIARSGQTYSFDYLAMTADGTRRWCESHSRALLNDDGEVESVLCVVRDISERKAVELRLSEAAFTDPLTGLANRRGVRAAIERAASDQRSPAANCIAVLDLDHFKRVNDAFGHDAGDDVLRGFARLAKSMVREHDLVARIGGEEFAIFFPGATAQQALAICERLRSELARTAMAAGTSSVTVTVSGGVAELGAGGIDEAFTFADRALYSAKRNGRDQLALAA